MIRNELRTGPWNLTDLASVKKNGLKVVSTFSCGGGSTMGYKIAGFEVIGAVEIDPKMAKIYKENHHPKYLFNMPIQEFNKLPDSEIPADFFGIDILDGSPPCSTFSMAGSREKKWGKESHFREGQAKQRLDELFFDFIETAKRLQPKVVVAENVKGLIQGNARGYVKQIFAGFREAGYHCQLFLLNAASMGVPQRRERTFFIANRLEKKIELSFNEGQIPVGAAINGIISKKYKPCSDMILPLWEKCQPGKKFSSVHKKGSFFNSFKCREKSVAPTVTASDSASGSAAGLYHWKYPRHLSPEEYRQLQTFPNDYNSLDHNPIYIMGMSVPPFMMQRIADQIALQFFTTK